MENHPSAEYHDVMEMHAIIRGHVQGVFFRGTTRSYAESLGLVGTVKNLPDGSVEIFAQGQKALLERLLKMLDSEYGPKHISTVEATYNLPTKPMNGFRVVR